MTTTPQTANVGLGEIIYSERSDDVISCVGLGSCIALTAHDASAGVGGLVHIVLPTQLRPGAGGLGKFADTAAPMLVKGLIERGALKSRIVVKMAGGAQLALARSGSAIFEMGERNAHATRAALKKLGLRLAGEDVGGTHGRTVRLFVESGMVAVSSAAHGNKTI